MAHPPAQAASAAKGKRAPRTVMYARRSDPRREKVELGEERSIEDQIAVQRADAVAAGEEVVEVIEELGSGVTAKERRRFTDMISRLVSGQLRCDVIRVYDLSRFGRMDDLETSYCLYQVREAGATVWSKLEGDMTSAESSMQRGYLVHANRHRSIRTAIKSIRNKIDAVKKGFAVGGVAPFGYHTERRPGYDGRGRAEARTLIGRVRSRSTSSTRAWSRSS